MIIDHHLSKLNPSKIIYITTINPSLVSDKASRVLWNMYYLIRKSTISHVLEKEKGMLIFKWIMSIGNKLIIDQN